MNEQVEQTYGWMNRQMDGWMDRQIDRQTDRQIDRQTDGQIDTCRQIDRWRDVETIYDSINYDYITVQIRQQEVNM